MLAMKPHLIDHQHLNGTGTQVAPADHVEDTPGSTRDRVDASIEPSDVLPNRLASDARMTLHRHVITERKHHLLRLLSELARGRKHKSLCLPLRRVEAVQHAH
eukprot:scaffold219812_cov38-Tisochrysis_lutea.AAC.1